MKRFRILGLTLLALFALGAFAASMASAEEGLLPTGSAGEGSAGTTALATEKEKISCTAVKILPLQWLPKNDIHGTTDLHFTGCKAENLVPANTLGDASEVILAKVLFLICLVNPTTLQFGIAITPLETVHVEIPAVKELVLVKGTVIAELTTKSLKGKEFEYNLAGTAGKQTSALKCEDGTTVKYSYEAGKDGGTDKPASQNGPFTLKFTSEVELMDS